jgi:signal transduction histidine kinase
MADVMESRSASPETLPGRILVVEDDAQILAIVALLLEDEGYLIDTASDGKQALSRLRDGPLPDLIVLDLMLPKLDGWEFRAIQRADPGLASIPVLAVSADSSAKAAAIDATGFLSKPFRADDLIGRVRAILGDRIRMEARLAEMDRLVALGRRAAEAAHEMSNPLGSVVANVTAIDEMASRMREVLEGLPAQPGGAGVADLVDRGRATLNEIEDTARDLRLGANRMAGALTDLRGGLRQDAQPFQTVDLRSVVHAAVALSTHEIRSRARLVVEVSSGQPLVLGNETRLVQLLTNLLINAAHAVTRGQPQDNQIRVEVSRQEDNLLITVEDTGSGIAPDVRRHIFEPFFTTKPFGVGTGLGLPICQAIAREHRGRIEVESEPGNGSRFRVILPVAAAAGPHSRQVRPISAIGLPRAPLRVGPLGNRPPGRG